MDFAKYYLKLTMEAINEQISRGNLIINAKRIRQYHNFSSSDKSKINFIWRNLERLEKEGLIELYLNKSPKVYKLPHELLKIENLVGDILGDTGIAKIKEEVIQY